jgi:hypothetical protein
MEEPKSTISERIELVYKAVEPFEKLVDGFGYRGVLLRDTIEDKLQCHVCGKWYKAVATHARFAHGMTARDYKITYGLPLQSAICSRSTSAKLHDNGIKHKNNLNRCARTKKWLQQVRKGVKHKKNNAAFQNKLGTCAEQIYRRFLVVADMAGKEPTFGDIKQYDPKLFAAIVRRYGNLDNFRVKYDFTRNRSKEITDESIIAALRKFYITRKRLPRQVDFAIAGKGKPSKNAIYNHFGSWRRALATADLI